MSTLSAMRASRRWLLASPEKVPHYVDGTPRRGVLGSPEDLARLASYSESEAALLHCRPGWHLGFALGPDGHGGHWQGVDLDSIDTNGLGDLAEGVPGYVETSPSGKGVHGIGYGRHFRTLGPNDSGIEAYPGGRFFTVTENMIRDAELVCLADYVESTLAPRRKVNTAARAASAVVQVSAQTVADLRSALNHMRSDNYAVWIELGHALKALGDTGRGLWLDWSATL